MSVIYPRQKKEKDSCFISHGPLFLDLDIIEKYFHVPQCEAAKRLGISLTCLKSACRKIGVRRWPYTRKYYSKHDIETVSQEDSQSSQSPTNSLDDHVDNDAHFSFSEIMFTEVMDHMMGKFDSKEAIPRVSDMGVVAMTTK
eukprot:572139-Hanusia_phi.AAC.3